MTMVFQYGSNATAARLNGPQRMGGRAQDLGCAQTVNDFDIAFDVYSQNNGCAASDLIPQPGQKAWGVLYEIADEDIRGRREDGIKTLTDIEGPRYEEKPIRVRDEAGIERDAITFLVKNSERRAGLATSAAYVSWIVYGLRDHGVPEDYLQHIVEVATGVNSRAREAAGDEMRLIGTL